MNEHEQAEALARWLAEPEGGAPADIDEEVVEAIVGLRPDLAAAPRVTAEEILASVTAGPLALGGAAASAGDADGEGAEVLAFPQGARSAESRVSGGQRSRWIAFGGLGGVGALLVAAATLMLVALPALKEGAPEAATSVAERRAAPPSGDVPSVAAEAAVPMEAAADRDVGTAQQLAASQIAEAGEVEALPARQKLKAEDAASGGGYADQTQSLDMVGQSGSLSGGAIPELPAGTVGDLGMVAEQQQRALEWDAQLNAELADDEVLVPVTAAASAPAAPMRPQDAPSVAPSAGADAPSLDQAVTRKESRADKRVEAPEAKRSAASNYTEALGYEDGYGVAEKSRGRAVEQAPADLDGLREQAVLRTGGGGASSGVSAATAEAQRQALRASRQAMANADYAQAVRLAESGLQQVGGDASYRAELYVVLGDARRGLGDLEGAAQAYRSAAAQQAPSEPVQMRSARPAPQ